MVHPENSTILSSKIILAAYSDVACTGVGILVVQSDASVSIVGIYDNYYLLIGLSDNVH